MSKQNCELTLTHRGACLKVFKKIEHDQDCENMQEVYDEVEIGFPNFIFSENFINQYAEDRDTPKDTVYGYVPMEELAQEIYLLLNIGI